MDSTIYTTYLNILNEELVPAMGCTEPIAIAYAAAMARNYLGNIPKRVKIYASGNIIKNVKSVIVPNTNGLNGIFAAVAAGIVCGRHELELEVISQIKREEIPSILQYLKTAELELFQVHSQHILDLTVEVFSENSSASIRIVDSHTNIVYAEKDDVILINKNIEKIQICEENKRKLLNVKDIFAFANEVKLDDIRAVIERQIIFNFAIASEGINGNWGANIGKIILNSYEPNVQNKARAYAAAGSDARMNGCDMPVVINSGSGNQGLTTSIPVIIYARELSICEERLYRALILANLVTIHLKTDIGKLSAYCGVISAGAGAAAGICYLLGGDLEEISGTIVNALAINSGVVCDGAKSSCAAKIASAVEGGIFALHLQKNGSRFKGGDGLVAHDVEETISNIGMLAREGMRETDKEIIKIMLKLH